MFTVKIYTLDEKDKANGQIVFSCEDYHKAGSVLIFGDGISEVIGTAATFNRKNSEGSYDTIWSGNFRDIFIENQAGKTIDHIIGVKGYTVNTGDGWEFFKK